MIRLRFTREKGWLPRLIRWFTLFPYDHVEIIVPDNGLRSGGFGGLMFAPDDIIGAHPKLGVRRRRVLSVADPIDVCRGYVECDAEVRKKIIEFCEKQVGRPYDWTAIVFPFAPRDWRRNESWICSELIAAAFEHAGMPLLNGNNQNRISPRDIALSPYVRY